MKTVSKIIQRQNLYQEIAAYMEDMIIHPEMSHWYIGSKLPSEQELADRFGVSRNVIREAVKVLQERGLIEQKNGVGAFITQPDLKQVVAGIMRYMMMLGMSSDEISAACSSAEKEDKLNMQNPFCQVFMAAVEQILEATVI